MAALLVLALLGGIIGFMFLSQATTGVGIIAFACLIAILARVAQAAEQHKELLARINSPDNSEHRPRRNFTVKVVRPGLDAAAELPASPLARRRHGGWCARQAEPTSSTKRKATPSAS